ncbi:hypothetical protein V2J09_011087 [Rumex salicifolius]
MPVPNKSLLNMDNRLIQDSAIIFHHSRLLPCLNKQQRIIYDKVIHSATNELGEFFFVYGAGGMGKTFLYNTIMERLRSEKHIVLTVASLAIHDYIELLPSSYKVAELHIVDLSSLWS